MVIRFCAVILILAAFTVSFINLSESEADWEEYKSDHFVIYYHKDIPYGHIREFSWRCEGYYDSITEDLGFRRFNFWLWENRARIFMYKTREDYLKDTAQPEWSGGSVHIRKKSIKTFCFAKEFFDTVLLHELTHIVLREFIGLDAPAPLWFDEGVACASEKDSYRQYFSRAKELVKKGTYVPIPEMEEANKWEVKSPHVFYPTAASLIIFLRDRYGKERFVQLCRELREGKGFYGAMDKIYDIKDAEDLNEKFLAFLGK